jgi:hypothetical protein
MALQPRDLLITIANEGDATTRNAAVIVEFRGFSITEYHGPWAPLDANPYNGLLRAQWDGGVNFSVHHGFPRQVPRLRLDEFWSIEDEPREIVVRAVADGVSPMAVRVPV